MSMNITNAKYTATGSITALVDGVQMSIPADAGNRHYAAILEQGITPAPYPVPTAAETLAAWREQANLTRTAFCIACKRMGILPPAEAVAAARGDWPATFADALTGLPVDAEEAQIVWAAATHISRADPVLAVVAQHAGMTAEQVDAMFGWTG